MAPVRTPVEPGGHLGPGDLAPDEERLLAALERDAEGSREPSVEESLAELRAAEDEAPLPAEGGDPDDGLTPAVHRPGHRPGLILRRTRAAAVRRRHRPRRTAPEVADVPMPADEHRVGVPAGGHAVAGGPPEGVPHGAGLGPVGGEGPQPDAGQRGARRGAGR